LEFEDGKISLTKNLCRKGEGRYRSLREDRLVPAVDGAKVGFDEAISRAAELLGDAETLFSSVGVTPPWKLRGSV
jgi:hypothetical protein